MSLPPFKVIRKSSSSAVIGDKENSNNSKVVLQQHCQGGNKVDLLLNNRDPESMIDDERDDVVCDSAETVPMSDLESNEAMMMVSNETAQYQSNDVIAVSSSTSSIGAMKLSYGNDHQHEEIDNNNHLDHVNDDLQEDIPDDVSVLSMGGTDELQEDDNDNNNFFSSDESEETIEAYKSEAPTNGTEEELSKYYWESCYGPGYVPPLTVQKSVPTKSW